jgi:beta-mannosidase
MGRFISEFGMHAAPNAETLRRVIPSDQLYHHSPAMDWHNKDNPKNKGDNLMLGTTGLPTTLDQYITFSQIAQAEGLKFGVEHFRRRKPHCSGTLVWQLDDCWPVLSWSLLDYYGFGKAGYYYLARAYAPVLASIKQVSDGELELWITNDTLSPVADTAVVRIGTFSGAVLGESTHDVNVTPNSSGCVARMAVEPRADAYVSVRAANGSFAPNRHFFAMVKDLVREPAAPTMQVTPVDAHELSVTLHAPDTQYVYFAHLVSTSESTRFSDNYVDLVPGETRELRVRASSRAVDATSLSLGWA